MAKHHDSGYKELFSHPEFVQQLIEGFAPAHPILPIVLYNGLERWRAAEDIDELVRPTPPLFLRAYQPHLRYYLIDEGRYTPEQLGAIDSPLSGVFEVEIASRDRASLQTAVDRLVRLIQADPNKARLDALITRWLKRHLRRLGAQIDLTQIHSLVEDKTMFAENLETWAQRERQEGRLETAQATARNLIALGLLNDAQIAQATGLSMAQVEALRSPDPH